MRQQLLRSLRRAQRPAAQTNAVRNLSSTARLAADVELTIDGKKVSIEGAYRVLLSVSSAAILTCVHSRLLSHPGLRKGRLDCSPLLLPREAYDCRKLQNVSG